MQMGIVTENWIIVLESFENVIIWLKIIFGVLNSDYVN